MLIINSASSFNIGINDGSILILLFILFELLNLDKLDDEFFKCSEFTWFLNEGFDVGDIIIVDSFWVVFRSFKYKNKSNLFMVN